MSWKSLCSTSQIAVAAAALVAVVPPTEARAAVRKCTSVVSSAVTTAATEQAAKKKALEQWRAEALKQGDGWDSWRLAYDKALKCFPKDNAFECVALGAPCIVDQTPRSPPKAKGSGI